MLSRMLTRKEQIVLLAFAGAIALGSIVVLCLRSQGPLGIASAETGRVAPHAAIPSTSHASAAASTHTVAPREETASSVLPTPPPVQPEAPKPVESAPPLESSRRIVVAVNGAVRSPGVYEFFRDARVNDLIDKAGGTRDTADLSDINLAAPLMDGTTLVVPETRTEMKVGGRPVITDGRGVVVLNPPGYRISTWQPTDEVGNGRGPSENRRAGEKAVSAGRQTSSATASGGLVNLNRATSGELEALPGVGPKLAEEIGRYRTQRPFQSVDDLDNVPGIGPKKLETLRPYVCVQ